MPPFPRLSPILKPAQPRLLAATIAYYRLMTPITAFFSGKKIVYFLSRRSHAKVYHVSRGGLALPLQSLPAFASLCQPLLPHHPARINPNQGGQAQSRWVKVSQGRSSVLAARGAGVNQPKYPNQPPVGQKTNQKQTEANQKMKLALDSSCEGTLPNFLFPFPFLIFNCSHAHSRP
jgi:hypothetical protein